MVKNGTLHNDSIFCARVYHLEPVGRSSIFGLPRVESNAFRAGRFTQENSVLSLREREEMTDPNFPPLVHSAVQC